MTYLEAINLSKGFAVPGEQHSRRLVFNNLSLHLDQGKIAALLGPSGSGKSTLLNILAGFIAPDTGTVLLEGNPCHGPGPDRAVVFQDSGLFPWLTAIENVSLGAKAAGLSQKDGVASARSLLAKVGLSGFEEYLPARLSGGMRQRVELARSLAMSPKVLLLDEPMASLDAMTRERMHELLINLHNELRMTVFLVTHDLNEALTLADTVTLMLPGEIPQLVTYTIAQPRTLDYGKETHELGNTIKKRLRQYFTMAG